MATPNYTEEEILFRRRARRRLVGAVVLVVAVIAIVPMILPENKPQQDTQQIEIQIPAQDATGYAPKIIPAPDTASVPTDSAAAKPEVASAVIPDSAPPTPAKPDKPQADTSAPAKPVTATPTAKPSIASKPSAATKQSYFVQYGAFSELKNAKQRQAELKTKNVNTFTEVVKTAAGDKIRVRSGPYAVREDAEKVRLKVKPLESKLVVTGNNP